MVCVPQTVVDELHNMEGSAIIYTDTHKEAEEVNKLLVDHGILSEFYHAGRPSFSLTLCLRTIVSTGHA